MLIGGGSALPQVSSNFNPNQSYDTVPNGPSVNYGGATGAEEMPIGSSGGPTGW
jgi:hypothetical protein